MENVSNIMQTYIIYGARRGELSGFRFDFYLYSIRVQFAIYFPLKSGWVVFVFVPRDKLHHVLSYFREYLRVRHKSITD